MLKIDWMLGYGNLPRICVEDSLDLLPREECRFTFKEGMWYHIQKNGLVRYLAHSGLDKNEGGFGGSLIDILDEDGNPKTLKGPWSSRASYLNTLLPADQQIADIKLYNGRSRIHVGILVSELVKLWDVNAYLLREQRAKGLEQGSFTASLANDCILKPNGARLDVSKGGYEIVAEPVNEQV